MTEANVEATEPFGDGMQNMSTVNESTRQSDVSLPVQEPLASGTAGRDGTHELPTVDEVDVSRTVGGADVRRYLNHEITPILLAGMREVARQRPTDPLRTLGEYLIAHSNSARST